MKIIEAACGSLAKLILLGALIVLLACGSDDIVDPDPADPSTPNILLIIADDMGLDATPGYDVGATKPDMPFLESLAASGLRFDNVWAYSLCSPTRATILTGKHGFRTGVLSATSPNNAISLSETSLQSYLAGNSSYESAVIGKWHLSDEANGGADNPNLMGVEYYAGFLSGRHEDYFDWPFTENGQETQVQEYSTTFFTDLAIDWIQQQQSPWFLWLAYTAPHTPFHLPPSDLHNRENLTGDAEDIESRPRPYYFAALEALDTELARLSKVLDADNTVIIFIGDNGSPASVIQAPYSGMRSKGSVYQGGIHVPMIVSGHGVTRSGQREDALISSTDLFATIADLAATGLDSLHDSRSFKELLSITEMAGRTFVYSEIDSDERAWAIRGDKYKLIEFQDGSQEFYNLEADPYEENDLLMSGLDADAAEAKSALEILAADLRN